MSSPAIPIPVTVLTGFLGAGKTTLLRYLLEAEHGLRIAVIENEYGAVSLDDELLGDSAAAIRVLANGCVCCTSRNDLSVALFQLLETRDAELVQFDRVVIECTGMADPGPVAQTFFSDEDLCERFVLDGLICLVDAVHADGQLDQHRLAQAQVGYADRLLLSKTDQAEPAALEALQARLQRINRRAPIRIAEHGRVDLEQIFDIRGFNLNDDFGQMAQPLLRPANTAVEDVIMTLTVELDAPLDLDRVSEHMRQLLESHGPNLLRYKGLLHIAGEPRRLLFQGVQSMYGADWDREWRADETPRSRMVFIGLELPEAEIRAGFARALA